MLLLFYADLKSRQLLPLYTKLQLATFTGLPTHIRKILLRRAARAPGLLASVSRRLALSQLLRTDLPLRD